MPPKKKVERAATENISLGPQVREGKTGSFQTGRSKTNKPAQVNSSLALPVSSHPSTIPLSMSPISGESQERDGYVWVEASVLGEHGHNMVQRLTFWVIPVAAKPSAVLLAV